MLLPAAALLACAQAPLSEPTAAAWRPRDGQFAVLEAGGSRLLILDANLRILSDTALGATFQGLAADPGGWLLEEPSGAVQWLSQPGKPAIHFAAEDLPGGFPPPRLGPCGRRLSLDAAHGSLRLGLAEWEHGGEIEWGPGWATLRVRVARVLGPAVEWKLDGGEPRRAPVIPDRSDPLLQRAYFEPVRAGQVLELRLRPPTPRYPDEEWTSWLRYEVPAAAGGARPVSVLPQDL